MKKIIICGEEFEYNVYCNDYSEFITTFYKNVEVMKRFLFTKKLEIISQEKFHIDMNIEDCRIDKKTIKEIIEKAYNNYKKIEERRLEIKNGIIL